MGRRADTALTDTFVRAEAARASKDGTRSDHPDGGCAGLQLRLSGRSASWAFRYRDAAGRPRRHKLGDYPSTKLAEARELANDVRKAVRAGGDPLEEKRARAEAARAATTKAILFREVAESYKKDAARRKAANTIAVENQRLSKHILPALGSTPFDQITRRDVRALAERLADAGHGVLANRVVTQISSIYRFAEDALDLHPKNPAIGMRRIYREEPRARVLSDAELKRLWNALELARAPRKRGKDHDGIELSPATAIALALVLVTAQRAGEVVGMAASEIDLIQKTWTIEAARVKNRRQHVVPLSPLAVDLIKEAAAIAGKSPFLFPGGTSRNRTVKEKTHMTRHALTRAMARACRGEGSLEIPDATVHDLRRTAATLMASERLAIPRYIVSRVLNHTSDTGGAAVVTQTYTRADDLPAKRTALDALASLIEEITTDKAPPSNVVSLTKASAVG